MPQLVGQRCVICLQRISSALAGRFCPACGQASHFACGGSSPERSEGLCLECGGDPTLTLLPDFAGSETVQRKEISSIPPPGIATHAERRNYLGEDAPGKFPGTLTAGASGYSFLFSGLSLFLGLTYGISGVWQYVSPANDMRRADGAWVGLKCSAVFLLLGVVLSTLSRALSGKGTAGPPTRVPLSHSEELPSAWQFRLVTVCFDVAGNFVLWTCLLVLATIIWVMVVRMCGGDPNYVKGRDFHDALVKQREIDSLIRALDAKGDPDAAKKLGLLGLDAREAVPTLFRALTSKDRNLRRAAFDALDRLAGKASEARDSLVHFIDPRGQAGKDGFRVAFEGGRYVLKPWTVPQDVRRLVEDDEYMTFEVLVPQKLSQKDEAEQALRVFLNAFDKEHPTKRQGASHE
jgi:hypothetical protein